ncbi:7TM diverse intracellular signaling domain-containing protein [Chryseolinea sp. T2]|uniref:7TM diverse intracellular signaling domain-containing protein n=1 Tax=Chryseolinea sp. T2 TaxID=3129255 RepID=UPI003077497A
MVRNVVASGVVLMILLLTGMRLAAQEVVQINDSISEYSFMPHELTYYVDEKNTLELKDVSSAEFARNFQPHPGYQNKDFNVNASYWVRIPIQSAGPTRNIWLLEFYDQTIDQIDAFLPQATGAYKHLRLGDSQLFSERTFRHKNFEIVLNTDTDKVLYYYFRIRSHEFADIRVALRSADRFIFYALNEYFLFGTFYGMILIISVYNLLVFLAIREIKNIYYIFYILSVAAYAMSYDGIGFQYLWPKHPQWNDYAVGVTLYSVILWALVFTRRFLNTKANAPLLDKALVVMIIARSMFFAIELLAFSHLLSYRNVEIIPLSLIFFTAIYVWKRGYRPARFFVIAYGILFTGFFVRTLVYFNLLPFTTPLHYSLHIAFVLEMVFLTFALGDRIRILKAMRDRALKRIIQEHEINMQLKDKVNRELEQKVQERTIELNSKNHELEQTNKKLERQSREINQINSMLDLDNWKLKNSLKEVLNDRIMEKAMDYAQFRTLYPDMLACYRFLDQLKWEKGFSCRKCGNSKYFDGAQKFSRRCTKCGYNESITSYTIFHSIKFPIEKAFYVAFLGVSGNREHTLEVLARQLDMRINTLWSFKQKVSERITVLQGVGHIPHASRWEEIILITEEPDKSTSSNRRKVSA